jgi:hypothetical protein
LPDKPSIAPDTSRSDEHFAKAQNSMLIKWSLVLNFLTYRSALHALDAFETMLESIKEISCPKTDCPKKNVVLLIVVWIFKRMLNYNLKKPNLMFGFLYFLPDNSEIK